MNWSVRSTTEDEGNAIVGLMREAGLHPDADPAYLQWKYWRPTELWEGPRSYVLADGPELIAHGAIVPGTLRSDATEARVIHIIDWAAREQAGGGGDIADELCGPIRGLFAGDRGQPAHFADSTSIRVSAMRRSQRLRACPFAAYRAP